MYVCLTLSFVSSLPSALRVDRSVRRPPACQVAAITSHLPTLYLHYMSPRSACRIIRGQGYQPKFFSSMPSTVFFYSALPINELSLCIRPFCGAPVCPPGPIDTGTNVDFEILCRPNLAKPVAHVSARGRSAWSAAGVSRMHMSSSSSSVSRTVCLHRDALVVLMSTVQYLSTPDALNAGGDESDPQLID
ncbi:hypothetical protein F4803DRAFT_178711 [Xylaria telfairii]|nr:hypothetical protein F4803DRAFT_178711 [Xylaria telfairii]